MLVDFCFIILSFVYTMCIYAGSSVDECEKFPRKKLSCGNCLKHRNGFLSVKTVLLLLLLHLLCKLYGQIISHAYLHFIQLKWNLFAYIFLYSIQVPIYWSNSISFQLKCLSCCFVCLCVCVCVLNGNSPEQTKTLTGNFTRYDAYRAGRHRNKKKFMHIINIEDFFVIASVCLPFLMTSFVYNWPNFCFFHSLDFVGTQQGTANLQSSINAKDGLGTVSLSAIYAAIVVSCIFLPTLVIRRLTVKWTLCVSMVCYAPYIGAQFYPK